MKKQNKKTIQIVVTAFVIVLCVGLLTSLSFTNTDSGDFVGGSSNNDGSATETVERSEGDPQCVHTYDDGTVEKVATCAKTGLKVFTCTKCGKTYENEIAKLTTHDYSVLKTYTDDQHAVYCSVCSAVKYESHSPVESVIKATCTLSGMKIYECPCGHMSTTTINA